jgi:hypothetical protein
MTYEMEVRFAGRWRKVRKDVDGSEYVSYNKQKVKLR